MELNPVVSVVIPVLDAASTLPACLSALLDNDRSSVEIIVVDDSSRDDSAHIAEAMGVRVIQNDHRKGPAGARNAGASRARGEILFFVDSDVVVRDDTVNLVVRALQQQADIAAVFGSYDDRPAAENFLSQYKNLFHHYVHQNAQEYASTFWAGCGAIRRRVFEHMGGFNESDYAEPSIEDIELGFRLVREGYRIKLEKELQAKHLKTWRWRNFISAEIRFRAIPWSRLIMKTGKMPSQLNLEWKYRVSGIVLMMFFPLLAFLIYAFPGVSAAALGLPFCVLLLNASLYRFFLKMRGFGFMMGAIPLHFFYYFYSSVTFASCWFYYRWISPNPATVSRRHLAASQEQS